MEIIETVAASPPIIVLYLLDKLLDTAGLNPPEKIFRT
jgi:hypothetical protein